MQIQTGSSEVERSEAAVPLDAITLLEAQTSCNSKHIIQSHDVDISPFNGNEVVLVRWVDEPAGMVEVCRVGDPQFSWVLLPEDLSPRPTKPAVCDEASSAVSTLKTDDYVEILGQLLSAYWQLDELLDNLASSMPEGLSDSERTTQSLSNQVCDQAQRAYDQLVATKQSGAVSANVVSRPEVTYQPKDPRVLVVVKGGVADYVADPGIDVVVFDRDNFAVDPIGTDKVPDYFRDLADPIDVPVESPAKRSVTVSFEGDENGDYRFQNTHVLEVADVAKYHNVDWDGLNEQDQTSYLEDFALWFFYRRHGDYRQLRADVVHD